MTPLAPPQGVKEHVLGWFAALDARPSTLGAAALLTPVIVLLMLPTSWGWNEDFYFIQSLLKVAPERAQPYGVAFDTSNARLLSEWVMGYPVLWFGYDGAHVLLRLVTALAYGVSLAYCITGLRLSPLDALLALSLFVLLGPDIMGGEWLFAGVEPKTFAYVFVFLGLGSVFRDRATPAAVSFAIATWFHFLVGGFWALAGFAFVLLQHRAARPLIRPVALFAVLSSPVLVLLVVDQYVAGAAAVPAHGLSADYIYGIVRSSHHTAPFHDPTLLPEWVDGIVVCLVMIVVLGFLAAQAGPFERGFHIWTAALLGYLLLAVGLSWLDRETSLLGKFFLFRPSSLILIFSILALLIAADRWLRGGSSEPGRRRTKAAAGLLVIPLMLWEGGDSKLRDLVLGDPYSADLAALEAFIEQNTPPDSVIISDPAVGLQRPALSLPRVIDRPMLVTMKITPTNPAGIYRWYDLLQFKREVFAGDCPGPDDPPVRYLILIDPDAGATAPCGEIIWRSGHFALAELPSAPGAGRTGDDSTAAR